MKIINKIRMCLSFIFLKMSIFFIDKKSFEGISFVHAINDWIKYLELSYIAREEAKINANKKP